MHGQTQQPQAGYTHREKEGIAAGQQTALRIEHRHIGEQANRLGGEEEQGVRHGFGYPIQRDEISSWLLLARQCQVGWAGWAGHPWESCDGAWEC